MTPSPPEDPRLGGLVCDDGYRWTKPHTLDDCRAAIRAHMTRLLGRDWRGPEDGCAPLGDLGAVPTYELTADTTTALTAAQEIRTRLGCAMVARGFDPQDPAQYWAEVEPVANLWARWMEHGPDKTDPDAACDHCPGEDVRHVEERQMLREQAKTWMEHATHQAEQRDAEFARAEQLKDQLRDTDADLEFARGRIERVLTYLATHEPHLPLSGQTNYVIDIRAILTDEAVEVARGGIISSSAEHLWVVGERGPETEVPSSGS